MRTPTRTFALTAALLLLCVGCGNKTETPPDDGDAIVAPDADVVDDIVSTDVVAANDTVVGEDVDTGDANLLLTVKWSGAKGVLVVSALPEGAARGGEPEAGKFVELYAKPVDKFPIDLALTLKGGSWMIGIQLLDDPDDIDSVIAEATVCKGGDTAPTEVPESGKGTVKLVLELHTLADASGKICLPDEGPVSKGVAVQKAVVEPPPTEAGGAHLLDAVVMSERMWIAGYQDGYVSFDFPIDKPIEKLANWKTYGQFECGRIERSGLNLFCTGRTDRVSAVALDPTQKMVAIKEIELGPGLFAEGLAAREAQVWIAVHGGGLRAISSVSPFAAQFINQPTPALKDAWDVTPLAKDYLLVADGGHGLRILKVVGDSDDTPGSMSSLPLPGVAAYVHATENQAVIGALGGGMHVVSVANPLKPFLQGTVAFDGMVFGVTTVAGMAVAAAGFHIGFVDLPPPTKQPGIPLKVRDVEPSYYFAMDVDLHQGGLLAAEFQAVRHFDVNSNAPLGPLLLTPKAVFAPQTAVGDTIKATLTLSNPGTSVLKVGPIAWSEEANKEPSDKPIGGPLQIAPGKSADVKIVVPKTIKGLVKHGLVITSNDTSRPETYVQLIEVSHLRPGETLPPLAYQDAQGKQVNVAKHFEGKVSVLLIAAHSCPVAFAGLKTASIDLKGLIASGKVAALAINPWDKPADVAITKQFATGFPVLYSPLTTKDGHDWSEVLDVTLGQPQNIGAPMPVVYVLAPSGHIVLAELGYRPGRVLKTIESLLAHK